MLLLCQTATAAQAYFMSAAQPDKAAESQVAPCHTTAENGTSDPAQPTTASNCDAAKAIAKPASVPVFPAVDLPPLLIAVYEPAIAVRSFSTFRDAPAICGSPPFTVLHCRFLI